MANRITPAQIRGARGMLDWSMVQLAAAAGLSVSTIKRVEMASTQPVSNEAQGMIQAALEAEGMRFLDDAGEGVGIRLRSR